MNNFFDNYDDVDEIIKDIKIGAKLSAVKRVKEKQNISLQEAKDIVDQIERDLIARGEIEKSSNSGCTSLILTIIVLTIGLIELVF